MYIGQHYDIERVDFIFDELDISKYDNNLGIDIGNYGKQGICLQNWS